MWCGTRMNGIGWRERKTNERMEMVSEERFLILTIENRRLKMLGHLISHDNTFNNILEG